MTTFFSASQDAPDFTNNVLVLPTLSVGKVGGLTVDLLAATYGLPRVGWLEDENVLPVASNDTLTLLPRPDGALSTNLEVFQDVANKVTYVQQRAPAIRNRNAAFVQNLFQWIKEARFREVVLLSSVDSARRIAEAQFYDRHAITCRYVVGGGAEPKSSRFKWPLLEEGSFDSAFKNTSFTHLVFDACKSEGLAATILTIFCADGVNIPHAFAMADAAFHYLDLSHPQTAAAPASEEEKAKPPRWRPPTSWHHLFEMASSFDATLFG